MTQWEPNADLSRLFDALGEEILSASDQEARQAFAEVRGSLTRVAEDVGLLIAATGDQEEAAPPLAEAARREHFARQH